MDDMNNNPVSEDQSAPIEQPVVPATTNPSTSGLAIAGLVLGILGILGAFIPLLNLLSLPLSILGLVLAAVGLIGIRNGKHSGKGIAIAGIVLGIIAILVVGIMYGGAAASSSTSSQASASAAASSAAASSAASSSSAATSQGTSSAASQSASATTNSKFEVTIDDARMGTDYSGNPCIIVTYSWKNNSGKDASFAAQIYPQVFQNGVSCDTAIVSGLNSDGYMAQVKPGYGTTVELAYKIKDNSDITVEVGPLINLNKEVWAKATFKLS